MDELISVVIPVYNNEQFISKCLDSVINQSCFNLQIIAVDDGSTDHSVEIIRSYMEQDKRIELFQLPHGGVCRARKYGIKKAVGRYTGFVDGDDWIDLDYFEKLYNSIQTGADAVVCGYTKEYGDTSVQMFEKCGYTTYQNEDMNIFFKSLLHPYQSISAMLWNKLLKTDMLKSVVDQVDDSLCIGEDAVMAYTCLLRCQRVDIINACGYHYVFNPVSLTESSDDSFLTKASNFYQNMLRNVKGHKYEKVITENIRRYIVAMLRNRMNYKLSLPEDVQVPAYYYPWYGRLEGKKVVLYGAGEVGQEYYKRMAYDNECQVVLWCDQAYEDINKKNENQNVQSIQNIPDTEYDYIVIAVKDQNAAQSIGQYLVESFHINREKILWNKTKSKWEGIF